MLKEVTANNNCLCHKSAVMHFLSLFKVVTVIIELCIQIVATLMMMNSIMYSLPCMSVLASFPVLPTPTFVLQLWRKVLHGCKTKAGVGRTGNEAMSV